MQGANQCDIALVLIDVFRYKQDMQKQVYMNHLRMVHGMEIENVIICFNKMDLIQWDQQQYELCKEDFLSFLKQENLLQS